MPPIPAPPLPEAITTGQLARLLGVTERVIAGRKADGRLPLTPAGKIDLRALVRRGVDASAAAARRHRREMPAEEINREAFSLAEWAAVCVRSALASPLPGEEPDAAAARGLRRALTGDDYFLPPQGWTAPEMVEADPTIFEEETDDPVLLDLDAEE